jgi:hypothetical protein
MPRPDAVPAGAAHSRRRPSQYREITVGLTTAQYAYLHEEAVARTTSIGQLVRELIQEQLPRWVGAVAPRSVPAAKPER